MTNLDLYAKIEPYLDLEEPTYTLHKEFMKFIMENFYYVPSSQLEFNFEIEGIVAFEEHIAEKDINKSRIIV